jgi:bifunctional DNA-binding transcriptional regulator/antitoxin component of YhaV-PrlF toxin-antitoxin module
MTVTVKNNTTELVVPASVRRQASIKPGDHLEFKASRGTITITVSQPTYRPTRAELSAIRKGEVAVARGEYVTLTELSNDLDRNRRKASAKTARKGSR